MARIAGFEQGAALRLLASGTERRRYAWEAFRSGAAFGAIAGLCLALYVVMQDRVHFSGENLRLLVTAPVFFGVFGGMVWWAPAVTALDRLLEAHRNARELARIEDE